jgi:hypothetical protein
MPPSAMEAAGMEALAMESTMETAMKAAVEAASNPYRKVVAVIWMSSP